MTSLPLREYKTRLPSGEIFGLDTHYKSYTSILSNGRKSSAPEVMTNSKEQTVIAKQENFMANLYSYFSLA